MHLAHFASPDKVVSLSPANALLVLAANIRAATLVMIANVRFIVSFSFCYGFILFYRRPSFDIWGPETFNPNEHLCKSSMMHTSCLAVARSYKNCRNTEHLRPNSSWE